MRLHLVAIIALVGCDDSSGGPDAKLGIDSIVAPAQIMINGTAVDGMTGTPLASASIAVYNPTGSRLTGGDATTDAQGHYAFTLDTGGFAPDGYVRVIKTGYLDSFLWPGPLSSDIAGLGLVAVTVSERDAIYAMAGRTADPGKLLVRVQVDSRDGVVAGAGVSSKPASGAAIATGADGVGYLLDAPPYLKITVIKDGVSASSLMLEAYDQVGQLVVAAVSLP